MRSDVFVQHGSGSRASIPGYSFAGRNPTRSGADRRWRNDRSRGTGAADCIAHTKYETDLSQSEPMCVSLNQVNLNQCDRYDEISGDENDNFVAINCWLSKALYHAIWVD